MSERICEIEGCGNLGRLRDGKRGPKCDRHRRNPALRAEKIRRHNRRIRANGGFAATLARQILKGKPIRNLSHHHRGMNYLLGGKVGDGLTVSRTCANDCPESYVGWSSGEKRPYRLCLNPAHYVLETHAENNARTAGQQVP